MNQTIISIGNSYGVIIPKNLLDSTGLKPGGKIVLEKDPNNRKTIILSQNGKKNTSSITPNFLRIVENINKKYSLVFKELANK